MSVFANLVAAFWALFIAGMGIGYLIAGDAIPFGFAMVMFGAWIGLWNSWTDPRIIRPYRRLP